MTLTVRLGESLATALELYCAERDVTKSLVVQEALATYLVAPRAPAAGQPAADAAAAPSANYRAFADAGLIGCVAIGRSADKAGVRARVAQRFAERKARRGGA